jgi:spoIIIJ-associated protein
MTETTDAKQEFTGKTMDEALAAAAQALGVAAESLEVEILAQPGSFSSLFGRKVRILAGLKAEVPGDELRFSRAPRAVGSGFDPVAALTHIAAAVAPDARVDARETDEHFILDVKAAGSGVFIGRKGATLEAIQYLMTLMSQKQGWGGKRILVDSERYRERRMEALREKARQLADKVLTSGQPQRTELLDAAMRKIVHSEIKTFAELRTKSIGEGDLKRVQIMPANGGRGPR